VAFLCEYRMFHKNGRIKWVRDDANLVRDSVGNPMCIQGVMYDITVLKETENKLQESESIKRAIIETSKDWIWQLNQEGVHTYSNPAIESILGYSVEQIVGHQAIKLIHPEEQAIVQSQLAQWVKDNVGWNNLVLRWKHKDGSYRYLESNAVPMLDSSSQFIGFQGVDRDITERLEYEHKLKNYHVELKKQVEQRTRELNIQKQKYQLLAENTSDVTWTLDAQNLEFDYISPSVEQLRGYTAQEAVKVPLDKTLASESLAKVQKDLPIRITAFLSGDESVKNETYTLEQLCKDGSTVWTEVASSLVITPKGELKIVGVTRNITERLKVEQLQLWRNLEYR